MGYATLKKLRHRASESQVSLQEVWEMVAYRRKDFGFTANQVTALRTFAQQYSPQAYEEMLAIKHIQVLCADDQQYPSSLRQTPDCPEVLFFKGPPDFWESLPIAIVGTRNMTFYGRQVTTKLTAELIHSGATIISGFMSGVDITAHQVCCEKQGKSVGVLGFGFDYFFPVEHEQFAREFLAQGNTLITEFPPMVAPLRRNFPLRNRIVAGMSCATVVIEAGLKSGTFITAQYANDYSRTICAVPGSIFSQYSEGTRSLLNLGAKLVASASDILEEVTDQTNTLAEAKMIKDTESAVSPRLQDAKQAAVYSALTQEYLSLNDLHQRLQYPVQEIAVAVSHLEISGYIERSGEHWGVKR